MASFLQRIVVFLRTIGAPNREPAQTFPPRTVISNDLTPARNTVPHFVGTYTLFVPVLKGRSRFLALLLAARCDSSAHGEQYRTARDGLGLFWAHPGAKMALRRVNDSNLSLVGSLGAGNPTDAPFIPSTRGPVKEFDGVKGWGYVDLAGALPLLSTSFWAPPGALFLPVRLAYLIPGKEINGLAGPPLLPLLAVMLGDLFFVRHPYTVKLVLLLPEPFHVAFA